MKPGFLVLVMALFITVAHSGCESKIANDGKVDKLQIETQLDDVKAADHEHVQSAVEEAIKEESPTAIPSDGQTQEVLDIDDGKEDFIKDNDFDCDLSMKPEKLIHQIDIPDIETANKVIPKQGDWLFVDWTRKSALFKWSDDFKTEIWFDEYRSVLYGNAIYLSEMPYLVAYSVPDKSKLFEIGPFERFDHALYRGHLYIAAHYEDYYQGSKNKDNVTLRKYSLDGTLIWERPSAWPQSESGKYSTRFIAAYNNNIYYEASGHFVAAIDVVSGRERWRQSHPFFEETISSSPNIDKHNNQLIFLARWPWQLVALDADTGEINWRQPVEPDLWPKAISDGIIFLSYSDSAGIVAVDAKTGNKLWDYTDKGENVVSLFVAKELLVFGKACTSTIIALNKRTGKLVWEINNSSVDKLYNGSLYCYDNKLIVYDDGVKIYE